jgi:hypothetical protein
MKNHKKLIYVRTESVERPVETEYYVEKDDMWEPVLMWRLEVRYDNGLLYFVEFWPDSGIEAEVVLLPIELNNILSSLDKEKTGRIVETESYFVEQSEDSLLIQQDSAMKELLKGATEVVENANRVHIKTSDIKEVIKRLA